MIYVPTDFETGQNTTRDPIMLFFSEADVSTALPMAEAIRQVRAAFEALASGEAQNQARRRLMLPGGSVLHSMAGAFGGYFGTKIYSTNPRHGAWFLFVLYRAEDARPLALFEANYLGQIRTGAATGVATDVLARKQAKSVGLIGTGFQAQSQLEAVANVRKVMGVRVWGRTPENRDRFAEECGRKLGLKIEPAGSAEDAVCGVDIVITATSAKDPVISADWISPGTHINAIGSNNPKRRELPVELISRASVVAVDSLEQAKLESGDLIPAFAHRGWRSPKLIELTDIISGKVKLVEEDAITIFKSNGLGLEDVAAAVYIYEHAQENNRAKLPIFHS